MAFYVTVIFLTFTLLGQLSFEQSEIKKNRETSRKRQPRPPPSWLRPKNLKKIKIGGIFPYQALNKRLYEDSTFRKALGNLEGHRYLENKYKLTQVVKFVPDEMYPMDVIDTLCKVMINQKVTAMVYATQHVAYGHSTASSQYLIHMASYTGIPIVAWNAENSGILVDRDFNDYRLLQIAPTIEHEVDAICAILKRYNWHKIAVITTTIAGSTNFVHLWKKQETKKNFKLEILSSLELDFEFNETQAKEKLSTLRETEARIFVLYSTNDEAGKVFKFAREEGLVRKNYLWIATHSVIGDKRQMEFPKKNFQKGMLGLYFNLNDDPLEEENALVPQIKNAVKIIQTALNNIVKDYGKTFDFKSAASCEARPDFTWQNGSIVYKYLKNAVVKDGESGDITHPELLLKFTDKGKLEHSYLSVMNLRSDTGKWEKVGGYSVDGLQMIGIAWPGGSANPPQGTPEKFHIRVVTLGEAPFINVVDIDPISHSCPGNKGEMCDWGTVEILGPNGELQNKTNKKCCNGYVVDLLKKLAVDVGFTFDLYKVPDGLWGLKQNGEWNGLVRELVDHKADMCATSLKINSDRAKDIDFSVPYLETGIAIIVRLKRGGLSPTAFLEPFEYKTWVFILIVSIHGSAIAIFFFEWLSPQSFNMTKDLPPGHKFSLFRSLWLVWATLFSASVNTDVPRSHTARFMALVWAAFSLTFLAVYTANLAAFMITRTDHFDLSGIDDPLITNARHSNPPFKFGTTKHGNTHQILKHTKKKLLRFIEKGDPGPQDDDNGYFRNPVAEGVKAVKNDELQAFIYDAVVLDYLAGKDENCEILTVGKWFSRTGYGLAFPKNSKLVKKIDHFMLEYQEKGVLEQFQNFWITGACTLKGGQSKNHSTPLGIENFMSAFILLAGGTVFGLLILCLEYLYCKHVRHKLAKIDKRGWCGLLSLSMGKSLKFREAVEKVQENIKADRMRLMMLQKQQKKQQERFEKEINFTTRRFSQPRIRRCSFDERCLMHETEEFPSSVVKKRVLQGQHYVPVHTEDPFSKESKL